MLLSIRGYAAHRKAKGLPGGTHGAVRKAIETGRVKLVDGKVDPDQADADWVRKTDPGKQRDAGGPTHLVAKTPAVAAPAAGAPAAEKLPDAGNASDFQKSRTAREYWESELSRLNFQREEGNLISRESAEKAWGGMVISARTKALYLPSQLASRLASENDTVICEEILKDAMHNLLSELSEYRPD